MKLLYKPNGRTVSFAPVLFKKPLVKTKLFDINCVALSWEFAMLCFEVGLVVFWNRMGRGRIAPLLTLINGI